MPANTRHVPAIPCLRFVLPDESGRLVTLDGMLREGPAAITFHRGHWCPWCRISLNALAQVHDTIAGLARPGGRHRSGAATVCGRVKDQAKSPFPVLTDMDNGYALSLNLAIWIGPDLERLLASYGLSICRPIRATIPGCYRFRRHSSSHRMDT